MKKAFAKFAGSVAVIALAVTVAAPSASALTAADIQLLVSLGVIPADKAQAALAIVDNNSATGNATGSCGFTYTRNLTNGSTGADVVALQTYLESKGFLTIPVGVSKGYFGPLTRSALASYQASVGITPAVGYFGPITMGRVTADCVATGGDMDDDDDDDDSDDSLSGGEASLDDYDRSSEYTNENLEEGETEVVFGADFEVNDGDAKIERIDVRLQAEDETGNEPREDEPWEQIESIAIYLNGDKIDEMDVDDEDDWSDESTNTSVSDNDAYEIRFSGLDEVFREGDDVEVTIEVTVSDSIDDSDLEQTWNVWIPEDGIRALDGEGIDQYAGSDSETTTFTIEAAEDGDLSIRESDDDPDSTILIVDADDDSDTYEVFRFEINNEDADIFLNEMTILASTTDDDIEDVISELKVEVDGEEFDFDTASTTSNFAEYIFEFEDNDDEIPLEEDEDIEVVVMVEFNEADSYAEGTLVEFGIGDNVFAFYTDDGIEAEGQQSGDATSVSGSQTSSEHVLRTEGVVIEGVSKSATVDNAEFSGDEEKGIYEIEVQLTALEDDAWVPDLVAEEASTTAGFTYTITNSGTAFAGTSTAFVSDDSSATETNGRHKISEGSSETFTIRVELNPSTSGSFGVELQKVNFASTSSGSLLEYEVPNEPEYETKKISVDA